MNARDGYVTLYIIIYLNFSLEGMVLGILPILFISGKLCAKEKRNGTTDLLT